MTRLDDIEARLEGLPALQQATAIVADLRHLLKVARDVEKLVARYSDDDYPTWINQVPRLTRTDVVDALRAALEAKP